MFDLEKIIRSNVKELKPYSSARDEFDGLASVSLDANENPFGFGLNRYPDGSLTKLKASFSNFRGIAPERLLFGNGSDEVIDLLIRAFCEPSKDKILVFPPTFGMYAVCAKINGVEVMEESLDNDFQINLDRVRSRLNDENLKLVFVCSPNNPSGNTINRQTILSITSEFHGLVIVDEAYIDFAEESLINEQLDNLFILQTFSKAFGLAGIRLGVGIGNREVIQVLDKIKPPYNVNSLTQQKALESLNRPDEIKKQVELLIAERHRIQKSLLEIKEVRKVFTSDANFLLVEFEDSTKTMNVLKTHGIIVRDRSKQVANALRITIGTPEENDRLLAALKGEKWESKGRIGECIRTTSETNIRVKVDLDGNQPSSISTGVSFFDHMLDQLARHGGIGLEVLVNGDLHIDTHHTIEDTALALGAAFDQALKDRKGIERYGFLLPMDDCLAQVAIDFGGRPWLEWDVSFDSPMIGAFPSEMASHFFKSFSDKARCNLNIKAEGENDHHKIESIFKAFARAIKMAVRKDESGILPSTKGIL